MILDFKTTLEIAKVAAATYSEELIEAIHFTTDTDNQEVIISMSIPFSGHITAGAAASNAIRVYLDGDSYYQYSYARYWNGELLLNSGTFPDKPNYPDIGHLSGTIRKTIPLAGEHTIHVQTAGATINTVTTIKSQRRYQVWSV